VQTALLQKVTIGEAEGKVLPERVAEILQSPNALRVLDIYAFGSPCAQKGSGFLQISEGLSRVFNDSVFERW
jgi:hypothetical protein